MEKYVVTGGAVLKGEVTISGAKNAVVAIIPATVLARDVCVIENIPNISDVTALLNILRDLGAKVRLLDKTTVEIDTTHIGEPVVSHELAKPLRASYYFLGSLLGRCGRADVSLPGGCNFGGVRPIDQHIKGVKALGAEGSVNYGMVTMASKEVRGVSPSLKMLPRSRISWIWQTSSPPWARISAAPAPMSSRSTAWM